MATTRRRFLTLAAGLTALGVAGPALAWSPVGTIERAAENEAAAKMARDYPAYSIYVCQMRSNKLSIAIATRNPIGNQVNFSCYTRRVVRRDGSVYYEVSPPQFVQ